MVKSEENIDNKNEKLLKSSEFRTFFENILDAVLLTIPDGTILAANPAAEELFGYTEEEICKIGRNGLLDKDDPHLPILIKERIRTGKAKGELKFIRKDGTKFPGEMSTSVFKDGNGDKRTSMVIRDITKRKQADKALKNSEERYRSILENIQDAYIRADKKGNIIMASPSAALMYKFDSPQEMIGISAHSLYKKPEDRRNLIEQLLKQEKVEDYESEALRKDGTSFLVSVNSQFHYNEQNQIQGTKAFVRDITERKKAENQIEYQANLLSQVNDAVIGFTPNLLITYWNKGAEQMYGYSKNEALGKTTTEILRPNYNPGEYQKLNEEINKRGIKRALVHVKHKNGAKVIAEIDSTQIINDSGNIEYIIVYRDITQQKNLEEKRQELLEQVQLFNEELEVSNEELQSITEELQTRNEEIQQQKNKISEILESIQDNFYVIDYNWNYVYINKQSANAVNMEPQDFIGQNHWKMFPQYVGTVMEENFFAAMEKREVRQFKIYSPYNNNSFLDTVYPSTEGITIIGTNITVRKKAETELERANQKINEILNSIQDDFYVLDHNWKFVYVSEVFSSKINKTPEDFVGQNIWNMFPKHIGTTLEENFRAALSNRVIKRFEIGGKYTDAWYRMNVFPSAEGITIIGTDITEIKKTENELEKTLEELKRSNKELEQFAYISSHDLQEPIRMVTSFTQLLERRYKGKLDNDADDYIEFIVEGSYRMKYLIDDLLTFSRVSNDVDEFENVDLEKVLKKCYFQFILIH